MRGETDADKVRRLEGEPGSWSRLLHRRSHRRHARVETVHLSDVDRMVAEGLVEPGRLFELYERVEPDLVRYPALDAATLRRKLEEFGDAHDG